MEAAARAAPDGYTIVFGAPGSVVINSILYKLNFDPLTDLTPVSRLTSFAFVLLGGVEIGTDTLLRWYVLHVLMLPFVIVIFMAIHFWRVRKDGGISGPL